MSDAPDTTKVTRFEVIDHDRGRVLVRHGCHVAISMQDQGRTMKVFLEDGGGWTNESA